MSLYGYARVQHLRAGPRHPARCPQSCGLKGNPCREGPRRDGRTELQALLDFVQPGDTLVVTPIDRLARSMKDLQDIVHELKGKSTSLCARPSSPGTSEQLPARRS